MKASSTKILGLLERRLELLHVLIQAGENWRRAFVGLRLQDSQRFVLEEELLCDQIRVIDIEIAALQMNPSKQQVSEPRRARSFEPAEMDLSNQTKILDVQERMAALQRELKISNDTRRAILKRSKLTINALHNLYNSHAHTYATPAAHSVGTMCEEKV